MLVRSSDKVLIGIATVAVAASAAVFGSLAWRKSSAPPPAVAAVQLADARYVMGVTSPAPVKTDTWATPGPQSRGREWVFDAFTPPEIYYNARSKQFTVRPPSSLAEEEEEEFGIELVAVRPEPFRLQLIGYFGDEGRFLGTFENLLSGETFLAGPGRRMPNLAVSIKSLEVKPQPVAVGEGATSRQRVATAVVFDEKTKREVVLTHRERKFTGTVSAFIAAPGETTTREVRPGDTFKMGEATFQIDTVQLTPPAIDVIKESPNLSQPDRRTLNPREPDETELPPPAENRS
ncbi:MAG: hypothetical protein Q7S40_03820 [Opitutaceae bacterium]|nr:hypothetical protein [Opitutaceae bacterium]